jgi:hypothetical protein
METTKTRTRVAETENINLVDLQVMQLRELENLPIQTVAAQLHIPVTRVNAIRKKAAYRDMVIAALEEKGYNAVKFADKLVQMLDKNKSIVVDHEVVEVSDNVAQNAALQRWGDILGVDAPKEHNISVAGSSDAELDQQIIEAEKQFGVDEKPGQPGLGNGCTGEEQGTDLPV